MQSARVARQRVSCHRPAHKVLGNPQKVAHCGSTGCNGQKNWVHHVVNVSLGPFLFFRSGGSGLHRTPHTAAGRDWRRCRDPTPSQGAKAAHDHISAGWCTAGEGTTVPKHGGGLAASAELQTVSGGVTFVVWRCCGLPIPRRCWGRVPSQSHRGLQKHRRRWRPLR